MSHPYHVDAFRRNWAPHRYRRQVYRQDRLGFVILAGRRGRHLVRVTPWKLRFRHLLTVPA